jgi:DNA-3-methyladenine glycosylase
MLMHHKILEQDFYMRGALQVARGLLGNILVSTIHGSRVSGIIYETEAYDGESDLACHARTGKTARNAVMYETGGLAYIYFTYGMHWMLNCVCRESGYPAAVLIRAIHPIEGLETIRSVRAPLPPERWCDGPAKLVKSLGITGIYNGTNLCDNASPIWIEEGEPIADEKVKNSARIGIESVDEPWKSKPWRFLADISGRLNRTRNWL